MQLSNNLTPSQCIEIVDPEGSCKDDNIEPVNELFEVDLNKGHLWVNTPHGIISIHIGFGGMHKITSWLPHEVTIAKKTCRGKMQVTSLEPTYESVRDFRGGVSQ